jgi:ParB family chromosome partitioning protein
MSKKRKGLGRGLDALLGSQSSPSDQPLQDQETKTEARLLRAGGPGAVAVENLEPNRFQPRSHFDETGLDGLAESIRTQGVVQPIVVTPKGNGKFTIIAGERRWRASQRAGLKEVPVVVREISNDQQLLEMALVENIQRADLNAIEEAEAYRSLSETFEISQEDIATRVGKARTTITNALRLLRLPQEVQDLLREGRLKAGQARPLLSIPDPARQISVAERAIEEGLTARDLEALVSSPRGKVKDLGAGKKKNEQELDVNTQAAVEKLMRTLQTKVEVKRRKRGGVMEIHYHSEEELIRIYDLLMQGNE